MEKELGPQKWKELCQLLLRARKQEAGSQVLEQEVVKQK
jgi:hypothetical protein